MHPAPQVALPTGKEHLAYQMWLISFVLPWTAFVWGAYSHDYQLALLGLAAINLRILGRWLARRYG